MAVAVDRGSLLIDHVIKSLRPARDVLLAIGLYYSLKNVLQIAKTTHQTSWPKTS